MKKLICLLTYFVFIQISIAQNISDNSIRFAIIIPMMDESIGLLQALEKKQSKTIDNMHYIEGILKGKKVVFTYAGLGKTNVSAITARLIHDYHPEFIFLSGSAGSINPRLNNHTVIIGSRLIDADLGTMTPQGSYFPLPEYFFTAQKNKSIPKSYVPQTRLLNAAKQFVGSTSTCKIILGAIATSDILPNSAEQITLLKSNGIDGVEMEGTAFMQTCWLFNANCIVIRGVSNNADEKITKSDTIHAANNAVYLVENMLSVL